MQSKSTIRIAKELGDFRENPELSLAVECRDNDLRYVKALIVGPHETPYEFGFFEFLFDFSIAEYPTTAPKVTLLTTHSGRTRFNPNFYSTGKVCLSILGTWRGEKGEQWSSAQGIESILLSIQSLMSPNPYENEPGFESRSGRADQASAEKYAAKIRHETLRISVIERLESYMGISPCGVVENDAVNKDPTESINKDPTESINKDPTESVAKRQKMADYYEKMDKPEPKFEPFKDLLKRRFLWYYASYMEAVTKGEKEHKLDEPFARAPFEGCSNSMGGCFNYPKLRTRLETIKSALDSEMMGWARAGISSPPPACAGRLLSQFQGVSTALKKGGIAHSVTLDDSNPNPLDWSITYFGRPMTNLDGAMLRLRMVFSPQWPEEQPRVRLETQIFHHHVGPDGTLCYKIPRKQNEDIEAHINAVFAALDEEQPAWDPREIVHPEASKLFWSKDPQDKKIFSRRLRRSVQDSMDSP